MWWNIDTTTWIENCPATFAIFNKYTRSKIIGTFERVAGNDYYRDRASCKTNRQVSWRTHEESQRPRVIHCPCEDAVHQWLEITFCCYFTRRGGGGHNLWPIVPSHSWWKLISDCETEFTNVAPLGQSLVTAHICQRLKGLKGGMGGELLNY